jgi:hypothetical protein
MSGGITPNIGLSITDIVNVTTSLTPIGAAARNFGATMLIGATLTASPLSTAKRILMYSTLGQVAADFAAGTPELNGATAFFDQSPRPNLLYIGFWNSPTETLLQAVTALAAYSTSWYLGIVVAPLPTSQADSIAAAQFIQGASPARQLGFSTADPNALLPSSTTDLPAALSLLKLNRSMVSYSASPFAQVPPMAVASTVDFTGSDTTLTLMFKQFTGIAPDALNETQAGALVSKNCNMYVDYNNGTSIYQHGVMSDGTFFDIMQGADALANAVTNAMFNTLLDNPKVPQTNGGVNLLINSATGVLKQFNTNGYIAPGTWNGPSFGAITTGQQLTDGYYIYVGDINTQAENTRQLRIAPPFQIAVKLAGAIQSVSALITINQ